MKIDQLEKLKGLRQALDPNNLVPEYEEQEEGVILVEAERAEIQQQLLAQHEEKEGAPFDMGMFEDISGPQNDEVVEVSYFDGVVKAYVDISLDNIGKNITEDQCYSIRQSLRSFARADKKMERQQYLYEIAAIGPEAVEVIFRECRQFDLVTDEVRTEIVDTIARLAYRNLEARLLVKGILEHSSTSSHTLLAIGVAGALRDDETVYSLQKHLQNQEYYKITLDALLKIRNIASLEGIIQEIEKLEGGQKHLVDFTIKQAPRFKKFSTGAIDLIFHYYEEGKNRIVRKVYIDAICAFGEDAIPKLLEAIEKAKAAHDLGRLSQICMTLGGLRTPASTAVLTSALQQANEREKRAIIIGLGRAADESVMDLIVHELKHTNDVILKSECINALSYLRGKQAEVIEIVTPYLRVREHNVFLDAMSCLVRSGNSKLLDDLVHYALNGTEKEQATAQSLISRLPLRELTRVGQRILQLPDDHALKIVTILQRSHKLSRELGPIIQDKLKSDMAPLLEMELYRLIAKHVNSNPPLLPAEVLYVAREKTTNERMHRELSTMISKIANRSGVIVTNE